MTTNKANLQVVHDTKIAMGTILDLHTSMLSIDPYQLDRNDLLEMARCSLKAKQAWDLLYYDTLIVLSDKDTHEVELLKLKIDELEKLKSAIPAMETKIDDIERKQLSKYD